MPPALSWMTAACLRETDGLPSTWSQLSWSRPNTLTRCVAITYVAQCRESRKASSRACALASTGAVALRSGTARQPTGTIASASTRRQAGRAHSPLGRVELGRARAQEGRARRRLGHGRHHLARAAAAAGRCVSRAPLGSRAGDWGGRVGRGQRRARDAGRGPGRRVVLDFAPNGTVTPVAGCCRSIGLDGGWKGRYRVWKGFTMRT